MTVDNANIQLDLIRDGKKILLHNLQLHETNGHTNWLLHFHLWTIQNTDMHTWASILIVTRIKLAHLFSFRSQSRQYNCIYNCNSRDNGTVFFCESYFFICESNSLILMWLAKCSDGNLICQFVHLCHITTEVRVPLLCLIGHHCSAFWWWCVSDVSSMLCYVLALDAAISTAQC